MFMSISLLCLTASMGSDQACQKPPAYTPPFCAIPTPTPLVAGKQVDPNCCPEKSSNKNRSYFDTAAQIAIPSYNDCGTQTFVQAMVIYEGMMFDFEESGKYTLAFTTTIPDQPVTLHLQLHFTPLAGSNLSATKTGIVCGNDPKGAFIITLPPIVLKPRVPSATSLLGLENNLADSNTFHVRHEGFSHRLTKDSDVNKFCLKREGSARFERPPPKLFNDPLSGLNP